MPLIYLPLIMYASWMEFMAQPLRASIAVLDGETHAAVPVRQSVRDR
jgi:hypothetical protein